MSQITFEASVFSRTVRYRNFKNEEKSVELTFALDPLKLMRLIAGFKPTKSKSKNPARAGQVEELSDEQQLKFVSDIACAAAGFASDDGESWEEFEEFEASLAGKAFLTKLAASDDDRKEFADKVILAPFRAFVGFAEADAGNSPQDIADFREILDQMENLFKMPDTKNETIEDRKARLARELASLDETTES